MKVLLVNKYYRRSGGAETVFFQTSGLLAREGHDVIPFAMEDERNEPSEWAKYFAPARDYESGNPLARARDAVATIYSIEGRRRLRALLSDARPDVAHLHNVYHQLTLSVVDELAEAGIPIVMTLHDYKPACPNYRLLTHDGLCTRCVGGQFWNAARHRCLKGSFPASLVAAVESYVNRWRGEYAKIDLFIAPSRFLKEVMIRAGLPSERIHVVPNALELAEEPAQSDRHRARFVYAGRLSHEKGLDVLCDAAGQLSPGTSIVLYGRGPEEGHLRTRIAAEGLPVELGGFLDGESLRDELGRATAALLPATWFENCPLAILEAGGAGTPTIASELGGIPERISHDVDGLLVPPGDAHALASAMGELADDSARATDLGRAAHRRVASSHNPERYIASILELYERARSRTRDLALQ